MPSLIKIGTIILDKPKLSFTRAKTIYVALLVRATFLGMLNGFFGKLPEEAV